MIDQPGAYNVVSGEYDLGQLVIQPQEGVFTPLNVRLRGSLHRPDAAGPNLYPVIALAHGRHTASVENFQGLDYLGYHLASHGFCCASVDLNDLVGPQGTRISNKPLIVTGGAIVHRAKTILRTLTELRLADVFEGRANFKSVGLVGHSRGGEAVCRAAAIDRETGGVFNIASVFSIAPVDFGAASVQVPFFLLYGDVDGDVSDGQSLRIWDRAVGERRGFYVKGAIHNFFSTNWENEWGDEPHPETLDRAIHENLARVYATAFFSQSHYGSQDHAQLLTGKERHPAIAHVQLDPLFSTLSDLKIDDFSGDFDPTVSSLGKPTHTSGSIKIREFDLEVFKANVESVQPTIERLAQFHVFLLDPAYAQYYAFIRSEISAMSRAVTETVRYLYQAGDPASKARIEAFLTTIIAGAGSPPDFAEFQISLQTSGLSETTYLSIVELINGEAPSSHGLNHVGKGLVVEWTGQDAELQFDVDGVEFVETPFLLIRCGQYYLKDGDSGLNTQGVAQNFRIALIDASGTLAEVALNDVSDPVFAPTANQHTFKAALVSRIIPISTFKDVAPNLDLSAMSKVVLKFNDTPAGAIAFGDIGLTKRSSLYA